MKFAKIIGILFLVYVGVVVLFETGLGYFQPQGGDSLVLSVKDDDGIASDRVLSRIEVDDQLYVAVNHWPRAWYRQAAANPRMTVIYEGETSEYRVMQVQGEEHDRVDSENSLGLVFRILTGFPPRYFVRLDPN